MQESTSRRMVQGLVSLSHGAAVLRDAAEIHARAERPQWVGRGEGRLRLAWEHGRHGRERACALVSGTGQDVGACAKARQGWSRVGPWRSEREGGREGGCGELVRGGGRSYFSSWEGAPRPGRVWTLAKNGRLSEILGSSSIPGGGNTRHALECQCKSEMPPQVFGQDGKVVQD